MELVRKSVQIKGNLKINNGTLTYKPYPSREFNDTYKLIAIDSVGYISNENVNTICTLSCSFVKSQAYNTNFQISSYEQPLQSFVVNTTKKFQLKNYGLIWFPVNSVTEELIFSIRDFQGRLLDKDIDISVTLFMH